MNEPYLIEFQKIGEEDIGYISVAETPRNLPFEVKRVYWIYDTPVEVQRGNHAHKEGVQVLIPVKERVHVALESNKGEVYEFELDNPNVGLLIPPMYWRKVNFSPGAFLLCLASLPFEEGNYIRDYQDFLKYKS